MGELVIQYHDFENAKKEIKKFSEQSTTDLDLKRVDDSKGVGEFLGDWIFGRGIGLNHKVTGEELNELTSQIQSHLHSINNTQIKLIKEFGQVYSALEALDKDYIQAILVSIKATEETSESIQKTQEQIKKIVENQRKTLEELKKFKQKLDGYAHLGDIDKIWGDCQKWHQEMTSLSKGIATATEHSKESIKKVDALKIAFTAAEKKTSDLSEQLSQMIKRLKSISAFTSALETITHLQDVDAMWESLSAAHDSMRRINGDVEKIQKVSSKHQEEINKLLAFTEKISFLKHLTYVDNIWTWMEEQKPHLKEVDRINEEQNGRLDALSQKSEEISGRVSKTTDSLRILNEYMNSLDNIVHLEDVDSTWQVVEKHTEQLSEIEKQNGSIVSTVQKNKEDVEAKIAAAIQETNSSIESLTKKLKYAYWIAGVAAGLAIIELMLLLL
ncbi:hypothetical protein [Lachnoclostridium phytofermentans]|uniref:hypothetical protein n=1 Tax=Lachnoclostridium phytofermentans TaxID=66219 RepID=UPI00068CF5CA|nr:hypothetical protein [Lachnoclostridium phytofermentans]